MNRHEQRILIYSQDDQITDLIADLCDASHGTGLRITIATDQSLLEDLFEHHQFALAFVNMSGWNSERVLDQVAFSLSPQPTIAIVESAESSVLLHAMRNGADSVFTLPELRGDTGPLIYCLDRQLKRAAAIEHVNYLRDVLSQSLEELKDDQAAARQIQERLLPPREQNVHQITVSYELKPSMLLSGDFVDLIPLKKNKLLFYLADVSGHGASSALVTVLLKNITNRLLRGYNAGEAQTLEDPEAILNHVNTELLEASLGKHMTMFIATLDTETLVLNYAVGGHHPMPVLIDDSVPARFLDGRGMPLGLFEAVMFDTHQLHLSENFKLFLFSDGILELIKGDSLEDKEHNLLELCSAQNASPQSIIQQVVVDESLTPDDVAVMKVSR